MALIPLQFGGELASISLQFQKPSYDDRGGDSTTNDARSRLDHAAIAVRSDRDRGSIGPRSWSSSTNRLGHPMEL